METPSPERRIGRPTVSAERRAQIYDATIRCIKRWGSSGTTLERIAAEAGMSRGHVRHFAGNRDQLMVGAARHFYGLYREKHPWADGGESPFDRASTTLDYLFGDDFTQPGEDNALVQEFVDQARTDPELLQVLVEAYSNLLEEITTALPGGDEHRRATAAYGVLCVALGNVFLADIAVGRSDVARTAAEWIVGALENGAAASRDGSGVHNG